MNEKLLIERRATCKEHVGQMREIFEKIDKRLPIWVFLAAIGIIGAAFSFVSIVSENNIKMAHNRMGDIVEANKESMTEVTTSLRSISAAINSINVQQAITATAIRGMEKDIDAMKQQRNERPQ